MPRDNREKMTTPVVKLLPTCLSCVMSSIAAIAAILPNLPFDFGIHSIPLPLLPFGKYQFSDRPNYSHFPSLSAVSFLQYQAITTPYVEEF